MASTAEDRRKIQVSKIEAATRQLDCAIELWFHEKDEVSIHTLLRASYQVIHDLNAHAKTSHDDLYKAEIVKPEFHQQWAHSVKEASNFFKHADKDREGTVEFYPVSNIMFMLYAITGLAALREQSSTNLRILSIWLYIHEPRFLSPAGLNFFKKGVPVEDVEKMRPLSKLEFFKMMLQVSIDFRRAQENAIRVPHV